MKVEADKVSLDVSRFENQCCECGVESDGSGWMWYGRADEVPRKSLMYCNNCWGEVPLQERIHCDCLKLYHKKLKEWSSNESRREDTSE